MDVKSVIQEAVAGKGWHYVYTNGDGQKEKHGPYDTKQEAHAARLKHFEESGLDPEDVTQNSHDLWTDTTGESYALRRA